MGRLPFHISVDAYRWLKMAGYYDDLLVTPAPMDVYEIACRKMTAEYLQALFLYLIKRKHHRISLF